MVELERRDDVFVLCMKAGENRIGPDFLSAWNDALDEVEASSGAAALVSTGEGRFYSTGLDLEWLSAEGAEAAGSLLAGLHQLFARVLAFPTATVAALGGHAFAAGGMLALAHDFRVMREDRGYFCLPEIDLRLPLQPGMTALIRARLSARAAHEAIVTGRRYGGADAESLGIVDAAVPEHEVLPSALALAADLAGKDRATMAALKRGLHADTLEVLGG